MEGDMKLEIDILDWSVRFLKTEQKENKNIPKNCICKVDDSR